MVAAAQTNWRHIGATAVDLRLAGPATGSVSEVWYAADGSLYARTDSGKTFQTQDFENWDLVTNPPEAPKPIVREPAVKIEPNAHYVATSASSPEVWGIGQQLYRSDDGKSWQTLTSYKSQSVIGGELHSVAISPNDPSQLAVANSFGVWRSMDGGLTWASLNQSLPNLAVKRILSTPSGGHPAQILTEKLGVLQLPPGNQVWQQIPAPQPPADDARKVDYSQRLQAQITALAESSDGRRLYIGSADGRVWSSDDGGAQFSLTTPMPEVAGRHVGSRVEKLFVDQADNRVVFAALSGEGHHLVRTFNGGLDWDPLDSATLPNVTANGVTARAVPSDAAASAVYVATDKGVYWTHFDFEHGVDTQNLTWTNLSDSLSLPQVKAMDVMLDPAGVQLYAALDGYGVYGTPAPHRGLRLVNTADESTRAAAPGSLVSAVGEKINSVSSGGRGFPLWNSSQFQVPFETVGPMVSLALETAAGTITRDLAVQPVSPAIFVSDGVPLIIDADSGLQLERNIAHTGQRLQVMVNGLGKVTPDWRTGEVAPLENPPAVVAAVRAYLDGSEVPVARATLAPGYIGMYVVEVQLPAIANYGAMELHITADGRESNHVQIVIAQ